MDFVTALRRLHLHAMYTEGDSQDTAQLLAEIMEHLDPEEQRSVIRHAYWRMPEVSTMALHLAVGSEQQLRHLAGRGPITGTCPHCGQVARARSRDALDSGDPTPCGQCTGSTGHTAPPGGAAGDTSAAGFVWEFQDPPQPWRSHVIPRATVRRKRTWAEHYPSQDVA
ncbi:MAG: hypothetical protein ACR2HR_18070 [Euzebya sp.]